MREVVGPNNSASALLVIGATNVSIGVLVDLATALGVDERAVLKPADLPPARVGWPPKRAHAPPRK